MARLPRHGVEVLLNLVLNGHEPLLRESDLLRNLVCIHAHLLLGGSGLLLTGLLLLAGSLSGSLSLSSLGTVILADGLGNGLLLLGLDDGDGVGKSLLGAGLALGVAAAHDLDLDAENTLAEKDVAGGAVDEVLSGLTGVDHEAVGELHGLGASGAQLAGNNDLATLGAGLHDEAENAIAGTTNGKTVEELVAEGLALSDGRKTAVLDLGGVQRNRVLGELEPLLDQGGELANAAALLSENLLSVGSTDNDICDSGRNAHFYATVPFFSQFFLEELIELCVEHAIGDDCTSAR